MAKKPTAPLPATLPDEEEGEVKTYHLSDYDWVPVRRVPRSDGWTIDRQRRFIEALADTGSVTSAAAQVHMSRASAYALRRSGDGAGFAQAWEIAIRHATAVLLDACMERVIEGVSEPIFDRNGSQVGSRRRFDTRLAMFLLRAHRPETFARRAGSPLANGSGLPQPSDIANAVKGLAPPQPEEPAALYASEEDLTTALEVADIMNGRLPAWQAGRDDLL